MYTHNYILKDKKKTNIFNPNEIDCLVKKRFIDSISLF